MQLERNYRMKKQLIRMFAVMLCMGLSHVYAADFFVAPNGNDANAGTAQAPFKTIARALTAANDSINGGMSLTATVRLADGTYDITGDSEPLFLDHAVTILGRSRKASRQRMRHGRGAMRRMLTSGCRMARTTSPTTRRRFFLRIPFRSSGVRTIRQRLSS